MSTWGVWGYWGIVASVLALIAVFFVSLGILFPTAKAPGAGESEPSAEGGGKADKKQAA